jgi:hypothetical protein
VTPWGIQLYVQAPSPSQSFCQGDSEYLPVCRRRDQCPDTLIQTSPFGSPPKTPKEPLGRFTFDNHESNVIALTCSLQPDTGEFLECFLGLAGFLPAFYSHNTKPRQVLWRHYFKRSKRSAKSTNCQAHPSIARCTVSSSEGRRPNPVQPLWPAPDHSAGAD